MSGSIDQMAQRLALPAEVLGTSCLEITGTRQLLICGHKGIRLYSETEIVVELRDCAVEVQGCGLRILSMTKTELLLGGTLDGVRFLR